LLRESGGTDVAKPGRGAVLGAGSVGVALIAAVPRIESPSGRKGTTRTVYVPAVGGTITCSGLADDAADATSRPAASSR